MFLRCYSHSQLKSLSNELDDTMWGCPSQQYELYYNKLWTLVSMKEKNVFVFPDATESKSWKIKQLFPGLFI